MELLRKITTRLFSITPLKITVTVVTAFTFISFLQDVSTNGLPIVSTLENKALDIKFLMRGPQKPISKIVIAAIDEKALATYGQWPFDRGSVLAPIIDRICTYNIKSLGLDVFWPEVERGLNPNLNAELLNLAKKNKFDGDLATVLSSNSGDLVLRKALNKCGHKLVMGYHMTTELPVLANAKDTKNYEERKAALIKANKIFDFTTSKNAQYPKSFNEFEDPAFESNTDFMKYRFGAILNNSLISDPQASQGYMDNDSESDDGNYRHYAPIMMLDGAFLPSLALRMTMKNFSESSAAGVTDAAPSIFLPDQSYGRQISLRLRTPHDTINYAVDKGGRALVNYRGPNYMFPHVSLADIMSNEDTISYTPTMEVHILNGGNPKEVPKPITFLKREFFNDALVLLGSTATGVSDIRPRPLDRNAFGVENHANALDNMINNDFLERPNAEILMVLLVGLFFGGLVYGLVIARLGAKPGALFAAVSVAAVVYLDQQLLFNSHRIVFAGHLQALQFISQYVLITVLKYAKEESDKKFIRGAFDKFVSPDVIEQMVEDPTKLRLGGEKKELTVLFSDIAGFTEMSEKIDVKVLTQFLNEYLGAMTDIVQANGGTLDKYIGDAVMAFWGAPVPNPQHAQLAVKTAVEMQKKVNELNRTFKEKYGVEIETRIGINSGEVSVGNFGSSRVFSYTVIGDNVNLASRLEGVNKYYGTYTMISESTYNLLPPDMFVAREIDLIKVKGKKKPVKIFQVLHENVESAKRDLLPSFQEGLSNYYARNWERAIANFTEVLKKYKNEKAAAEFIERCKYYSQNPPQDNWDGSWEMQSK